MGNNHTVNCLMAEDTNADKNNNKLPGLMKRACQRVNMKCKDKPLPAIPNKKNTKDSKKHLVLRAMPRCSSFENLSSNTPCNKEFSNDDPTYTLWRKAFEQRRHKPIELVQNHLVRMRRRVHNMSSAVSGHLTPRGFPAFTLKTKSCKKSLKIPQLCNSPRAERKIPVMHSENANQPKYPLTHIQLPNKVTISGSTFTTKTSSSGIRRYTMAPVNLLAKLPHNKQAIIIEQLYRDIKDVESRSRTRAVSIVV